MAYATRDDLYLAYDGGSGELARLSDGVAGSTENLARINQALDFATERMNEELSKYYDMPIAACGVGIYPIALVAICCALARYELYDDTVPDNKVVRDYDSAIKRLKAYGDGSLHLFCPSGAKLNKKSGTMFVAAVEIRPAYTTNKDYCL